MVWSVRSALMCDVDNFSGHGVLSKQWDAKKTVLLHNIYTFSVFCYDKHKKILIIQILDGIRCDSYFLAKTR